MGAQAMIESDEATRQARISAESVQPSTELVPDWFDLRMSSCAEADVRVSERVFAAILSRRSRCLGSLWRSYPALLSVGSSSALEEAGVSVRGASARLRAA